MHSLEITYLDKDIKLHIVTDIKIRSTFREKNPALIYESKMWNESINIE